MKMMHILLLMLVATIVAACGRAEAFPVSPTSVLARPTETPIPEPNADLEATAIAANSELGLAIFSEMKPDVGFACETCHAVEGDLVKIGPSLAGIAETATERVEGVDAYDYIYASIVNPNEYVVDGFAENLMPQTYADILSEEEVDQLVQYLLGL